MKLPLLALPAALVTLATFATLATLGLPGCSSQANDQPSSDVNPSAFGSALRIKDVMNPASPKHAANGAVFSVSGAAYLWTDTFDETHDGKSVGTVYIQDAESTAAFSGASLYEPSYVPASLRLAPGDIIDLPTATYEAEAAIGSVDFPAGQALIQISKPDISFRFDSYLAPAPAEIAITDLNDFNLGNQWNGMLVTVKNVTFASGLENADGRVTAFLTQVSAGTVQLSNELFDVQTWNSTATSAGGGGGLIAQGKTITSLTGIVTWFEGYHIAPRYPADIVQ